jgi:hypothetical protein
MEQERKQLESVSCVAKSVATIKNGVFINDIKEL